MGGIINLCQPLEIQMGIDLCGRNLGMAQQLLHGTQVATGLQHMACEGVTQHMGMDCGGHVQRLGPLAEATLHCSAREPAARSVDKQGSMIEQLAL
jgi:hypothetical protein